MIIAARHPKDIEANRFAWELIMPQPFVQREWDKLKKGDDYKIRKLSKMFNVPEWAMGIRCYQMKLGNLKYL